MFTVIMYGVGAFVVLTLFGWISGKGKTSDQRNAIQTFGCSIMTIFNKNMKDVNKGIRTASVIKEEAIQEIDKAIKNLKDNYIESQVSLKTTYKKLVDEILPNAKDQPGILEGKARTYKKKYEESVSAGHPIEAHKTNALRALENKVKATENIKRVEKNIEKIAITIEEAQANYDGDMMELTSKRAEIECMIDIPRADLNASLNRIRSIQTELTARMNENSIRAEVENEMRNEVVNYSAEAESEFERL